ncbi:MAG: hypothetical protein EPN25_02160 [Nitrospirae bacterium]|nr:MAG: hypothetical protein EPN25_02160 [Nitrospirota bacterium]
MNDRKQKGDTMMLRSLAEGIILQSVEDLWNNEHHKESIGFFQGEDFRICAEIAGMSLLEQVKLLTMLYGVIGSPKAGLPAGGHMPEAADRRQSGTVRDLTVSFH